jgi:hypothetical protein
MLVRKFRRAPSIARYGPTSVCSRRPSASGGLRCGRQFHCRPALRRPGLSMPRLILSLGTRSPPLASYLAQCAQRELRGSVGSNSRALRSPESIRRSASMDRRHDNSRNGAPLPCAMTTIVDHCYVVSSLNDLITTELASVRLQTETSLCP